MIIAPKTIVLMVISIALLFLVTKSIALAIVAFCIECTWAGTVVYLKRRQQPGS